jgi:hypothetical protein
MPPGTGSPVADRRRCLRPGRSGACRRACRATKRPAHQSDRPTARALRSYLMNQGALCSTFRQLLDVDIREVNAQHLASVGPQPDDQLHPADPVDNKETTVVASDREPNRPAQVNGRCRPLACQTGCSPPARKRSAGEPIGCQTPTCASIAMPGRTRARPAIRCAARCSSITRARSVTVPISKQDTQIIR